MKRLNKKGFSIVEIVIAMAVISIVTATALSIVTASSDNTRAAMYKADAQYLVYDALECFKVSQDKGEFDAAFAKCRETLSTKGDGGFLGYPGYDWYLLSDSKYNVLVNASYENNSFNIIIKDGSKNTTVAQITNYWKQSQGGYNEFFE